MHRPKASKLAANAPLRAVVEEKLGLWSPQQIAGWLGRTYPDDEAVADLARDDLPVVVRADARRAAPRS